MGNGLSGVEELQNECLSHGNRRAESKHTSKSTDKAGIEPLSPERKNV
jgi:hypothetical protein